MGYRNFPKMADLSRNNLRRERHCCNLHLIFNRFSSRINFREIIKGDACLKIDVKEIKEVNGVYLIILFRKKEFAKTCAMKLLLVFLP